MINCGTDIVKISRLEKALETPGFYEKVFGKRERAEFENAAQGLKVSPPHLRQRKHSAKPWEPEYAAFPCAKRKFCIRKRRAVPFLSGKAKAVSDKIHAEFSLSLSHDGDYATAFVICVTKGENIL